jgi:hypothetical protein
VAVKVNLDLQLTLMASSLYRLLGAKTGNGHEKGKSRHVFRGFIDATAALLINENDILVRFQKRFHNPFLIAANFDKTDILIPWLGIKKSNLCSAEPPWC